jgi:hypothetical protein
MQVLLIASPTLSPWRDTDSSSKTTEAQRSDLRIKTTIWHVCRNRRRCGPVARFRNRTVGEQSSCMRFELANGQPSAQPMSDDEVQIGVVSDTNIIDD